MPNFRRIFFPGADSRREQASTPHGCAVSIARLTLEASSSSGDDHAAAIPRARDQS